MRIINKGENIIIRRNLKQANGDELPLSNVESLKLEILQSGTLVERLEYPSQFLRLGELSNQIEIEVSTSVSNRFRKGRVTFKYEITVQNDDFAGEGIQKDVIEEAVLVVK